MPCGIRNFFQKLPVVLGSGLAGRECNAAEAMGLGELCCKFKLHHSILLPGAVQPQEWLIGWNMFVGPIPDAMGRMLRLQAISLDWNQLSGSSVREGHRPRVEGTPHGVELSDHSTTTGPENLGCISEWAQIPRQASTLIFKIRSCTVRSDLKNKAFSADFVPAFKIRSDSARSDLQNKSARFSGLESCLRKIPAPIEIKSALPPQKTQNTPPPKGGILWTWRFSCRKSTEILGVQKIGAAISGPRIADKNFADTRIFLNVYTPWHVMFPARYTEINSERGKGGWKKLREGKTHHKDSSQKQCRTPPPDLWQASPP